MRESAVPDDVWDALFKARTANYINLATLSFLTYDTILNIAKEIDLIWRSRWSWPKVLYIFSRYFGLISLAFSIYVHTDDHLSLQFCRSWILYDSFYFFGPLIFTTAINSIFVMRVVALYGGNKIVLYSCITAVAIEFATELYGSILASQQIHAIAKPSPDLLGCSVEGSISNLLPLAWVPCLLVPLLFFLLTIGKTYSMLREMVPSSRDVFKLSTIRRHQGRTIQIFLRDGALFFGILHAALIPGMIFSLVNRDNIYNGLGMQWVIAAYSYTGSKIILNLREDLGAKVIPELSDIQFNSSAFDGTRLTTSTRSFHIRISLATAENANMSCKTADRLVIEEDIESNGNPSNDKV